LRNNLSDDEAAWFAAHAFKFPGVTLQARWVREYPQGEAAAHVLGYVGRISEGDQQRLEETGQTGNYRGTQVIGKKGIEKNLGKRPCTVAQGSRKWKWLLRAVQYVP